MGKKFESLNDKLIEFIENQKIFFVGTATDTSRVNISPKGLDSLKVLSNNRVIWLNVTGSGNETAAHVLTHARMTLMFCAFEGPPMTLRLYGNAKVIHQNDSEWDALYQKLPPLAGARQIFDLDIDLVQTSCGMSIPYYDYVEDRKLLSDWAENKGQEGLKEYWEEKNRHSIDGIETEIVKRNI